MSENNSASASCKNFSTPKRSPECPKGRGQRGHSHGMEKGTSDQPRYSNRYRHESDENCKTPDQKKRIASPLYKETPKRFRIDSPDRSVIGNITPRRSYEDLQDDPRRSSYPLLEVDPLFLLVYGRINK